MITVFLYLSPDSKFSGEPVQIHEEWGKFAIFDGNRRLPRKRYEITHGCYETLTGIHIGGESIRAVSMTLSDL